MSDGLLDDGRPVAVEGEGRIGTGPWARLLATSIVGDEGSARAERGRALARGGHVHTVCVTDGAVTAHVVSGTADREYAVELAARPLPPRVWAAAVAATGDEAAAAGREQSVRLEHELAAGWGEPLVPPGRAVRRSCSCPDADFAGTCKHVVALAYVLADRVDRDPGLLLRWRGCTPAHAGRPEAPHGAPAAPADPWEGGELPEVTPARALPTAIVLKRLGPSGIRVDGVDLADVLERAYATLARG